MLKIFFVLFCLFNHATALIGTNISTGVMLNVMKLKRHINKEYMKTSTADINIKNKILPSLGLTLDINKNVAMLLYYGVDIAVEASRKCTTLNLKNINSEAKMKEMLETNTGILSAANYDSINTPKLIKLLEQNYKLKYPILFSVGGHIGARLPGLFFMQIGIGLMHTRHKFKKIQLSDDELTLVFPPTSSYASEHAKAYNAFDLSKVIKTKKTGMLITGVIGKNISMCSICLALSYSTALKSYRAGLGLRINV